MFLQQRQCAELVRRLTGADDAGLSIAKFDALAGLSDVLDELRTAPLLAPKRIVIVREADKFILEHAGALEKYLASPPATGTLILLVDSWPPKTQRGQAGEDMRQALKPLDKAVRRTGELIACSTPSTGSLPRWISQAAEARRKQMAPQAARLLAEWVGADLGRLDGEIEKLAVYVGDRKEISADDVSAVAVASGGYEPFALTNAIERRDTRKALAILAEMLTSRGEEIKTLGMLAWHVRKTLARAGRPVGAKPGVARNTSASVKARRDTRKLLATDLAIKSGAEPTTAMQLLVMGLCT